MIKMHEELTPAQYQAEFNRPAVPHILVDVRSQPEYAQEHIPNAIHIELESLPRRLHELDADTPVILYCRTGRRSDMAAQFLVQAGYKTVYNLGGIIDWRKAGLPIE